MGTAARHGRWTARRRAVPLPSPVRLLGYADPEGAPAANRALSAARAQAVADQLVAEGVARSRIRIEPRGETPYADATQESRRVEIRIGG
jgi:outer membrane protein OmpA-like peptidoglycan-associated protein